VTIHLEFPWEKKRNRESRLTECASEPPAIEPRRPPPHPCEYQGHDYAPLAQNKKFVIVFCPRCCDPQRISIHQPPVEVPRPKRCADLA